MPISHTPGPWYAVGYWVEHEDDSVADICTCDPAAIGQEHLGRTGKEIAANVRLIAASPDLLAALRKLVRAIDRLPGNNPLDGLADEARAAIFKATGA